MCRLIRGGGGGMAVEGAIVFTSSKCCEVWKKSCVLTFFCLNFCRMLYVLFVCYILC